MNEGSIQQINCFQSYEGILFVVMIMIIMVFVLTGRGIDLSTTWLTMITAAGLAEYDSPPQIAG